MINFSHAPLADRRMLFPAMARLQETRSFSDSIANLHDYAKRGAVITVARDEQALAGTMGAVPIETLERGTDLCHEVGIDPALTVVRCMIYVDPKYRGQGISTKLQKRLDAELLLSGRQHVISYGYETQTVFDWIVRNEKTRDTGMVDYNDYPVLVTDLEEK